MVRSQLTYCSQIWRPHLIKDILSIEKIQRRATKFILNDFSSDYKSRLVSLGLLPLMFLYELFDILFFLKCLKFPESSFVVESYVTFSSLPTRSGSNTKLVHKYTSTSLARHSYFCRLARIWNALPPLDLSLSFSELKHQIKEFFWNIFLQRFNPDIPCSYHFICPCGRCSHTTTKTNFTL